MDINDILKARETRVYLTHQFIKTDGKPVVLIKANIPGNDKNIPEAFIITSVFLKELKDTFSIYNIASYTSSDGPFHLLSIDGQMPIDLKKKLVSIEEEHLLGRFVDLDLYVDETYSISRVELSLHARNCYICHEDARICAREKRHTTDELLSIIQHSVRSYISSSLDIMLDDAIKKELTLEHKFGLVTPTSNGSHKDMDYHLMLKAKDAIKPFFIKMFELNYVHQDQNELFQKARLLGMIAEEKMLEATNGINAYKGLIFILGLTILSYGHALMHGEALDKIFSFISIMTKDITHELVNISNTHGSKAYKDAHLRGARGEAEDGLPTIHYLLTNIHSKDLDDHQLRDILKTIILKTEDTVFYHRAKRLETYHAVKHKLSKMDVKDLNKAIEFTEFAIQNNLSFGGSADLLICYLFLNNASSLLNKSTLSFG